jgi:predicted transposase YdaD
MLLSRANPEVATAIDRQGIIEIISRIMVYKFTNLSSQEIDEMLDIRVEETRVYQEAQEKERRSIAINMLRKHLDLAMIAEVTRLSIEQLQTIQSENQ